MKTKILATVNFKEVQDWPAIVREYHGFRASMDMEAYREVKMAHNGGRLIENKIIRREDVAKSNRQLLHNPDQPTSIQLQIRMLEEDGFYQTQHNSLNGDLHFVRDREFYYNDETRAVLDTLYEASVSELKRELSDAKRNVEQFTHTINNIQKQATKRENALASMTLWQRVKFAFIGATP